MAWKGRHWLKGSPTVLAVHIDIQMPVDAMLLSLQILQALLPVAIAHDSSTACHDLLQVIYKQGKRCNNVIWVNCTSNCSLKL